MLQRRNGPSRAAGRRRASARSRALRPALEGMEPRVVLSAMTWTGAASSLWSNRANWSGDAVPEDGDDLTFPAVGTSTFAMEDDLDGLTTGSLEVDAAYSLTIDQALNVPSTNPVTGDSVTLNGAGDLKTQGAGTLNFSSQGNANYSGQFTVAGNVKIGMSTALPTKPKKPVKVLGGGTLGIGGSGVVFNTPSLEVSGTVDPSGGEIDTPALFGGIEGEVVAGGVVGVGSKQLTGNGDDPPDGSVIVEAGGTITPGSVDAPGTLELDGATTFQAGSTLAIRVLGPLLESQYDSLLGNSNGSDNITAATLALTLSPTLAPGNFDIMAVPTITGTFAAVTVDGQPVAVDSNDDFSYQGSPYSLTYGTRFGSDTVILAKLATATTTTLSAPTAAVSGQSVTLRATVSPGSGDGVVTFLDGSTTIGTATPVGGVATLSTSSLAAGVHSITADFGGSTDGAFLPSLSSASAIQVAPSLRGTLYLDLNANGTLDPGEVPLAGRVVFLDLKGDGAFDPTDPTATTDANGSFTFPGVAAGSAPVLELTDLDAGGRHVVDEPRALVDGSLAIGVVPISAIAPVPVVPDPFSATPAPDLNGAFVQALYRAVLGRTAAAGEVAGWVTLLDQGVGRLQVSLAFVNSYEHRQDEVAAYYEEFLRRAPDPGASYWADFLTAGGTEEAVVQGILGSAEYHAAHPTPTAFVDALYEDVLGRVGDASGVAFWASAIGSGMTDQAVVAAFVGSTEADAQVIDTFYVGYLRRPLDPGASYWVNLLASNAASPGGVAVEILASDEFFSAASAGGR